MSRVRLAAWLPPAAALLVMATRALYARATGLLFEDAFITLRYARNLAEGQGLVFNAGERVLGTTSPLLALLLAPVGWLAAGAYLPLAATTVGIASAGAVIWLQFRLCRRLALPDAVPLAATLLVAASYELVVASVGGMESMLVVALMFGALVLLLDGRPGAAGALLGLLLIARVDGALWAALVVAWAWRQRAAGRVALGCAAVVAPWAIFAFAYYGSPLPHTLVAKWIAYAPPPFGARLAGAWALVHPLERGAAPLARVLDVLFAIGAVASIRRRSALALPALACAGAVAALAVAAPQLAPWHLVPAATCFALVCGFGAHVAGRWLWDRGRARALGVSWLVGLFAVTAFAAGARTIGSVAFNRRVMENERAIPIAAGDWLNANSDSRATVFAEPLGFLGFRSRRYLWDTVGLVSPRITDFRRHFPADNRWYWESLRALAPDFVVLRGFERMQNRMFAEGGPWLPPEGLAWFDAHYQLAATFAGPQRPPEANWLAIYRRVTAIPEKNNSKN